MTPKAAQNMPENMPVERPFSWACGKCRGENLYREDDRLVGDYCIACPTCGNRYYNDIGRVSCGVAPVKVYSTGKAAPAAVVVTGHFAQGRMANILTGPGAGLSKREKEEIMSKEKRPCANCGRVLPTVSGGHCWKCYTASKGLTGEERMAALASIKANIDNGEIKPRGEKKSLEAAPDHAHNQPALTTVKKADLTLKIALLLETEAGGREISVLHSVASLLGVSIKVKFI